MKKVNTRKLIVILSFVLFPITFIYFSPYIIILDSAKGIISGSFIVFCSVFITSILSGRLFCGWLCPCGGAQECLTLIVAKKTKGGKLNWIKYFVWVTWIGAILYVAISAGGYTEVNFLNHSDNGISLITTKGSLAYPIYYAVMCTLFIMTILLGKRSFCHYLCWMAPFMVIGTKLQQVLHLPSFHLQSDKNRCNGCKQCNNICPMSLDVEKMAQIDGMTNTECILCGECIKACPKKVISYKYGKVTK